ncbi:MULTISPECIES: chromate transporter [Paenibacillus]|uniref:Chromate transporter n=2 Tax=Paenibacillus TaxID=44249 RepID=A0ABU6D9Z9_9BACL|nr:MULTISPECIES: chromate transporter [Paenibacillus]MBA2942062.1 chromate transporter [Paenibacillus sp. CGMCC 1.16610]MCY9656908.1 chromate transporter [Paenibacillus anseongense]MEB4794558.1 chromate transporter [Paenibacillus chondroitinus]MVQ35895.1 chromate transporter [Paenibacillus anseongense]
MPTNNFRKLISIFWTFLRISPLTFGGGYAMLPAIHREVVETNGWMSDDEMTELLAISGAAPGGVGVNVSALVGYHLAGIRGAVAAVIGITLPTFIIVMLLSMVYAILQSYPKMQAIMEGIHAAIVGLIAAAAYKMAKSSIIDKMTLFTAIATVLVLLFIPISPILVIGSGFVVGIAVVFLKQKWGMKDPFASKETKSQAPMTNRAADYFIADGI